MKKTAKRYIKEDEEESEDEAIRMKESEDESEDEESAKRKTRRVGGKLIKEDEDEDEEESEDRLSKPCPGMRKEDDEDEDEEPLTPEEEEEARKMYRRYKAQKGELGGESPSEQATAATQAGATITPGALTPSPPQHVYVPTTGVVGSRIASAPKTTGVSPSDVTYSGKSVNPDLLKSPLFVELNKSIDGIRMTMSKKLEAIEKSLNDRLANLNKTLIAVESFYEQPFFKSIDTTHTKSIKEKAEYSF
jgi:hypothetical protein